MTKEIEKKDDSTKEVETEEVKVEESQYKILADAEVKEESKETDVSKLEEILNAKRQEIIDEEEKIVKAKFSRKKEEARLAALGGDEDDVTAIKAEDIASIVKQELANTRKQSEETTLQNLISGVEDKYQAIEIGKQLVNVNPTATAEARFQLAKTLAEAKLQEKLKDTPDVEIQGGGFYTPSQKPSKKDKVDPTVARLRKKAGLD